MYKIFIIIATLLSLVYSQGNIILSLRPNGTKYKKIELGIESLIRDQFTIKTILNADIATLEKVIKEYSPKMVLLMEPEQARIWKKAQREIAGVADLPSIVVGNSLQTVQNIRIANSAIVTCEIPLSIYIDKFKATISNTPKKIGMIYTPETYRLVQSYLTNSTNFNTTIRPYAALASDIEGSINANLRNLIKIDNVDFLIVLDDPLLLTDQIVKNVWAPVLQKADIPIVVPARYYFDNEPKFGTMAIQTDYSIIGQQIAAKIIETKDNSWLVRSEVIYASNFLSAVRGKGNSITESQIVNNVTSVKGKDIPKERANSRDVGKETVKEIALTNDAQKNLPVKSSRINNELFSKIDSVLNQKQDGINESAMADTSGKARNDATTGGDPFNENENQKIAESIKKSIRENSRETRSRATANEKKNREYANTIENESKIETGISNTITKIIPQEYRREYVEITVNATNVLRELTSEMPVLGIGRLGERFLLINEDSSWYKVDFFGQQGFLSKKNGKIWTQKPINTFVAFFMNDAVFQIVVLSILLFVVFIILFQFLKRKRYSSVKVPDGKSCLIVAKNKKRIEISDDDKKMISLEKYLEKEGFHVTVADDLEHVQNILLSYLPDIICVDWRFAINIRARIYNSLMERTFVADFIIIFYNMVDSLSIKKEDRFADRTFFFGNSFTSEDMHKVVAPVLAGESVIPYTDEKKQSYLEGKILPDNLPEIFQLIEASKKTGCLLIDDKQPIGMIFFENGIITYAATHSAMAENAVFQVLSLHRGTFRFVPDKISKTRNMQADVVALLMEWAKMIDETTIWPYGHIRDRKQNLPRA
jgi:hypothetical protein